MKLAVVAFAIALSGIRGVFSQQQGQNGTTVSGEELPITTTDVFVQSGEVSESSIIVMARCNKEVDSTAALFLNTNETAASELQAFAAKDYTVSFQLDGLTSNTHYDYQVVCTPLDPSKASTTSLPASFKTLPQAHEAVPLSFVWAADLAGQGWGRNPEFEIMTVDNRTIKGGYVVFDVMESLQPDFAIFQGDMIYADNPIPPTLEIPQAMGGGTWINNPSKDFVAITLDDFRANWKYNFGDEKMQSFLAQTPIFCQWDDHEVTNNWWPTEVLGSVAYQNGTAVNSLYMNSLQAFYEFNPLLEGSSIYRKQRFGKHLEIFFLDFRSHRDPNTDNRNPNGIAMMGKAQLEWLKQGLLESTATWKILSDHDPLSIVTGSDGDHDSFGQGEKQILGRELEVQDLFSFIHSNKIKNVVSLTSDVHYSAHVTLDPAESESGFSNFTAMHEFVIGPIHAGSFGPNDLDTSFGATYKYSKGPFTEGYEQSANLPPLETNLQSFGHAAVSEDGDLEIKLIGITGEVFWEHSFPGPVELNITDSLVFVQSGEVTETSANIMVRCNDELDSSVKVLYAREDDSTGGSMEMTAEVDANSDYTTTIKLERLESNTKYQYSASCTPNNDVDVDVERGDRLAALSMEASFKTSPAIDDEVPISFVWAADLAGQGWGRNPEFLVVDVDGVEHVGGYIVFEQMRKMNPDFAIFQGDMIYADGAISASKLIPQDTGGGIWYNNPTKDFVAVTLDEFRANWKYNFGDEKMQKFLAQTPIFVQWDDHEVTNNWYPSEILGPPLYEEGLPVDTLFERSLQAFYEYNPLLEGEKIYRNHRYGKHLEIFFLDLRSYRDMNTDNSNANGIAMMGEEQLQWFQEALVASNATWKVISTHDPLGIVTGGPGDYDSWSQEECKLLGREHELSKILGDTIYSNCIQNVVAITTDVHYSAAISYDPKDATFKNFLPFYEFVSGPIHAGAFGPGNLDGTFGPTYEYVKGPGTFELGGDIPPTRTDLQTFGYASVTQEGQLTIQLIDIAGNVTYSKKLSPISAGGGGDACPGAESKKEGSGESDLSDATTEGEQDAASTTEKSSPSDVQCISLFLPGVLLAVLTLFL